MSTLALALAGDVPRAESITQKLTKSNPSHTLLNFYWLPTIRAAIELDRNNPEKALELLQAAFANELGTTVYPLQLGSLFPAYVRGGAHLRRGQGADAAGEFQKFLDHRGIILNSPLGALARLGIARVYALQDDATKARTAHQDFLTLWKDADPDIPIYKQAKAEYAKLQ